MLFCRLLGTSSELISWPLGAIWSRKIFEVMPKELSYKSLLNTNGYVPLAGAPVAGAQPAVVDPQPGGRISPTVTLAGLLSYTLLLTTRFPGQNLLKDWLFCAAAGEGFTTALSPRATTPPAMVIRRTLRADFWLFNIFIGAPQLGRWRSRRGAQTTPVSR